MNVYGDVEACNRLFYPFYRVLGDDLTGTGLGMVINKTFAKKWFSD